MMHLDEITKRRFEKCSDCKDVQAVDVLKDSMDVIEALPEGTNVRLVVLIWEDSTRKDGLAQWGKWERNAGVSYSDRLAVLSQAVHDHCSEWGK